MKIREKYFENVFILVMPQSVKINKHVNGSVQVYVILSTLAIDTAVLHKAIGLFSYQIDPQGYIAVIQINVQVLSFTLHNLQ